VAIVKNGCPRLSREDDGQPKRCNRRALSAGEILDRHRAALREAKIPEAFADLMLRVWHEEFARHLRAQGAPAKATRGRRRKPPLFISMDQCSE
jgi:hypothetical protein